MRSLKDLYHLFLVSQWRVLLPSMLILYIATNAAFAGLYLLHGGAILNARPQNFTDAFFFSAQTLSTLGYGVMAPQGFYGNVLATFEAFLGLTGFAMGAALLFAKFSRPTARVIFSKHPVVTIRDGQKSLLFRLANERTTNILEAQLSVVLVKVEKTLEGETISRLYDLNLIRGRTPTFSFTWTAIHPINESSPLWGCTKDSLCSADARIFLIFTGLEDSYSQTVHARHNYWAREILWNHNFADILSRDGEGKVHVDYSRMHDTVPVQ